ncbi:hypothetical protein EST38_g8946 [Candolleomyces aberdarensis]|uniref:Uncharacterized protein n=1 Tax=Candolleomyces aberdarensis TaxID=2316362 RepID=A0A4Q2DDI4_9AGAR|nr:hypothetical protein EST38_g8946 [Candolleomyces aberdarensis]
MPQVAPQDIRSLDTFLQTRVPQDQKPQIHWPDAEEALYASDGTLHIEDHTSRARKHSRTWDQSPHDHLQDPYAQCEDISGMPPRKRMHHGMMPEFGVMNAASLQPQNMSLPS